MRWLIFLSRASFISGIIMLVALAWGYTSINNNQTLLAEIILAGYGLAAALLPFINLLYLIFFFIKKKILQAMPRWLIISNIIFLCIFLIFTFYINDPYYYKT